MVSLSMFISGVGVSWTAIVIDAILICGALLTVRSKFSNGSIAIMGLALVVSAIVAYGAYILKVV